MKIAKLLFILSCCLAPALAMAQANQDIDHMAKNCLNAHFHGPEFLKHILVANEKSTILMANKKQLVYLAAGEDQSLDYALQIKINFCPIFKATDSNIEPLRALRKKLINHVEALRGDIVVIDLNGLFKDSWFTDRIQLLEDEMTVRFMAADQYLSTLSPQEKYQQFRKLEMFRAQPLQL